MKRLLFAVLVLVLVVPCYAGKVVDVDKLNAWIQANQREEAVVTPPPVVPPPVTPPVTPPTSGAYKDAVSRAHKLDTVITNSSGVNVGLGMGYYKDGRIPGPVSCGVGKTYFLLDTSWKSSFRIGTVKWLNMDVGTGKSQTTRLIQLDANDGGAIISSIEAKQDSFSIRTVGRYLIEVEAVTAFGLSIWW